MVLINEKVLEISTPGIYSFYFDENDNHRYIGCSGIVGTRIKAHINALLRGTHANWKIQQAFDKALSMRLELIQHLTDEDGIYKIEEHYIEKFNSCYGGLNLSPEGRSKHYSDRWKNAMTFALRHTLIKPRKWTFIVNDGILEDFDDTILRQVFAKNDFQIINGICYHAFDLVRMQHEEERATKITID